MTELGAPPGHRPCQPRSAESAFDVVGIGAFNIDYLADASILASGDPQQSLGSRIAEVLAAEWHQLEWDTERAVDESTIHAALAEVEHCSLASSLGGSAFNTITALAQLDLDLRLGFVGLAGRVPVPGRDGVSELARLGVDHTFARRDPTRLCGICFALQSGAERALLTHAGANSAFADYLDDTFDRVVEYLASARVIHVTSFLDDRTAGRLAAALRAVKSASPDTQVSFDPGHVWSQARSPGIDGILQLTDYLLVNDREFQQLSAHAAGEDEKTVAGRILSESNDRMRVMVKRPDGVMSYRLDDGTLTCAFHPQAVVLPDHEVTDATGAGDVFAAGLLTAVASPDLSLDRGIMLGLALARHKLRVVGTGGHGEFATITHRMVGPRAGPRSGHRPASTPHRRGAAPSYVDDVVRALCAELPDLEPRIVDLYTLLVMAKGTNTTAEDVHDAWAIWRRETAPSHPAMVRFADLAPQVRAMDQPFLVGIHRAAEALSRREAAHTTTTPATTGDRSRPKARSGVEQ